VSIDSPREVELPKYLKDIAPKAVVIHPSPLNAYKKWPSSHWVEVIQFLIQNQIPVFISGGPAKVDTDLAQEILGAVPDTSKSLIHDLSGKLTFSELATFLRQVRAYIGVDTSVTHLAAATNTPTIALFGATPPTNFGPWPNCFKGDQPYQLKALVQTRKNVTILQGPQECVPCRKAGCDDHSNSRSLCLEELSASRVIELLNKILF
jgi:heptosyltransferase-3